MKTILVFLQGKKTYVVTLLAGIYAALIGLDLVPSADVVWALLGTSAVATLRAGIAKAETPNPPAND